jgi:hypothetical protein
MTITEKNWQETQEEFMKACGQDRYEVAAVLKPCASAQRSPIVRAIALWARLIEEETVHELLGCVKGIIQKENLRPLTAIEAVCSIEELTDLYDGAADALYVICGLMNAIGLDLDSGFREVHRSNMTKVNADGKVLKRDDGKILKPVDYTPPDLRSLIALHLPKAETNKNEWQVEASQAIHKLYQATRLDSSIDRALNGRDLEMLEQTRDLIVAAAKQFEEAISNGKAASTADSKS